MFGYIYLVRNKINGKQYIGQKHSDVFIPEYLGSGVYLKRAVKKYGKENFEHINILEWCETKDLLDKAEQKWIDAYDAVNSPEFYNLAKGGIGTVAGSKHSIYWKQTMSKVMSTKTHTEKTKQRIREVISGRVWVNNSNIEKQVTKEDALILINQGFSYGRLPFSEEHRRKAADARKGHCYESEESRKRRSEKLSKEGNPFYGKHHSDEKKAYWSQIRKGRIWIHKDGTNTTINADDFDKYLNEGWIKGMAKRKSSTTIESIANEKNISE